MSGSVRQFEKSRAEIPDAASSKMLHQNPQHQPQQPPRKRESPGQAASTLSVTNRHGAQIDAEQNRRKATGRHRKEAPQRQSLTAEAQVLRSIDRQQAKSHNSNARNKNRTPRHPTTRNPTPTKGRKQNRSLATQSRSRDLSAPPHSDSLKQPINHLY